MRNPLTTARGVAVLLLGLSGAAWSTDGLPSVLQAAPAAALISSPGVQVTAGADGAAVALKVSFVGSTLPEDATPGVIKGGSTFTTWSLSAQAPLGKEEKRANLLTIGGTGNATLLGLTYTRFTTDWRNPAEAERAELAKRCDGAKSEFGQAKAEVVAAQAAASAALVTAQGARDLAAVSAMIQTARSAAHAASAVGIVIDKGALKKAPDECNDDTARALRGGPTPGGWIWGVTAKYGTQDATYYDETSLVKSTERNRPWSAGLVLGLNPAALSGTLFTLTLERAKAFTDAETSVRCPGGSSGPVACLSGSFGAPQAAVSTVISVDARTLIGDRYAISVTVSRDHTLKLTAVEIPFYWLANATGGLTGGVKLGWNSSDKKPALGVFVGVPFAAWQ